MDEGRILVALVLGMRQEMKNLCGYGVSGRESVKTLVSVCWLPFDLYDLVCIRDQAANLIHPVEIRPQKSPRGCILMFAPRLQTISPISLPEET